MTATPVPIIVSRTATPRQLAAVLNAGAPPIPAPEPADDVMPMAQPRELPSVRLRLATGETVPMLRFVLGGEHMLASLADVREALDDPTVHPVPHPAAHTRGVVAVRGSLVPARDVSALLGVAATSGRVALVVSHAGRRLAVLVDDVLDAVTVQAGDVRPLPSAATRDGLALGAVAVGGRLALVLDVPAVVSALAPTLP
jgi:purine-binding chemotaxis protein CheW